VTAAGSGQPGTGAGGRTALITGAGSGIGYSLALAFAAQGYAVVVNDYDGDSAEAVAEEIVKGGGQSVAHAGDVANEKSVRGLASLVRTWASRVDVLVNNAGIADTLTPTVEQNIDDWQRVVDVCLRGTYLCSREVVKEFMLPQRSGRIVNIASIAGVVGLPTRNAYSASKAGVVMMTRTMASEWARSGITVNAVAPGYIRTPMLDELISAGKLDAAVIRRRIPAGELGTTADIASAVLFLSSDGARYVTGTCLPVDGGWSAYGAAGDAFSDPADGIV
jgi:NAD(P)-dependent dehydrogenase (short-subunit alcohol dehydrogenase family)